VQARFGCGFPGGNAALKAKRILPTADIGAEDFFLRLIFLQWLLTTPRLRDVMHCTKGDIAWTVS
jgi:hypothetical protein